MGVPGIDWVIVVGSMLAIAFGVGLSAPRPVHGQDADPDVRQRALEAYHGPDMEGKDGPLARVGFDLALLYYEWRAYRAQEGEGDFTPSASSMPVRDDRVTVDATAAGNPVALQQELEALGLKRVVRAGRVVSGRLPIAAIPEAAELASLQAMRPARAMTHRPPPAPADTAVERPAEAPEQGVDRTLWYVVGGAAVAAVVVAAFLLQR